MIELKALDRGGQFIGVRVVGDLRLTAQVTLAGQTPGQCRDPRILHAGAQQRAIRDRLPLGQRLLALPGIDPAQVLILRQRRAGQFESTGYVLYPGPGDCQQFGLTVRLFSIGVPYRFKTALCQATETQVLQGLQVLTTGTDVGAQVLALGQPVIERVQPVVGQLWQGCLQSRQAPFLRPYRLVVLALIKGLQKCLGLRRQAGGQCRAGLGQLQQSLLQRVGRRVWQHIGPRDQWRYEQGNAQVTCVFFDQLLYSNPWPSRWGSPLQPS